MICRGSILFPVKSGKSVNFKHRFSVKVLVSEDQYLPVEGSVFFRLFLFRLPYRNPERPSLLRPCSVSSTMANGILGGRGLGLGVRVCVCVCVIYIG